MSLFFDRNEEAIPPYVSGASAGMNSMMFWGCPACGACVFDVHYDETNRRLHEQWRAGQDGM